MIKKLPFSLLAAGALMILTAGVHDENGKAGYTGSPGELLCNDCHNSFAINSGGGTVTLNCSNITNWEYVPGTTYHMSLTVTRTGSTLFGLGVEALQSSGANGGTLVITNSAKTLIKTKTVNGNSRANVTHQQNAGFGTGTYTFDFDWVAPATNIGNITFYFVGNASNNNGNTSGDYVYNGSQVISPSSVSINENTVANLNAFFNAADNTIKLNNAPSKGSINMINLNGEVVLSQSAINDNMIDVTSLPNGTYILTVVNNGATQAKKLTIVR